MAYKKIIIRNNRLRINKSIQGETLEMKLERMLEGKEPITNGAPIIYTERKDGVNPMHDIRTDRFEVAIDAMDKSAKITAAKREAYQKRKEAKKDGKPESTEGTKTSATESGKA